MGRLYRELLVSCIRGSRDHQEVSELAIKFAREAVRLRPASTSLKVRLANLLSGNHISRRFRNEAEALEIIKQVETGNCSSEVCHTIGKFYGNQKLREYNSVKALEWFEKALKAHVGNFPCFMDMLRNAEFQRKSLADIIQTIDKALNYQPKQTFKCQLMFVKGFFLWTIDHNSTLEFWLMAMEEAADYKINFVQLAVSNWCFLKYKNPTHALSMMQSVKDFMNRKAQENSGNQSFTKLVNVVDSVIADFDRQARNRDMASRWQFNNNENNGNWRKK